jgi:hypothetical protein
MAASVCSISVEDGEGVISSKSLAALCSVSVRYIREILAAGKVSRAAKVGRDWLIPERAAAGFVQERQEHIPGACFVSGRCVRLDVGGVRDER